MGTSGGLELCDEQHDNIRRQKNMAFGFGKYNLIVKVL